MFFAARMKFTDASGEYDNEPAADEQEFSDDDEERRFRAKQRHRTSGHPTAAAGDDRDSCFSSGLRRPFRGARRRGRGRGRP